MINVEIKARCTVDQHRDIKEVIQQRGGMFKGTDQQIDTYFNVPNGRLKLREGNIENCLIQYDRPDQSGPKVSKYKLVYFKPNTPIKSALTAALGVLVVVDKMREIYYLDNVKIHLDTLAGYGTFLEIEARDELENIGLKRLNEQTNTLMGEFGVRPEDLITDSYSDMLLRGK